MEKVMIFYKDPWTWWEICWKTWFRI